jgi:molybdopterin/thiamine biosynthesis adenylyltransferase
VLAVNDEHYLVREADRMSIASDSYASVAKQARLNDEAIVFVHSHPDHYEIFSPQDDHEDPKLMAFFASRVPGKPHGCLVLTAKGTLNGRVWADPGWHTMVRIRMLGNRFRFVDRVANEAPLPEFFDRNVKAFGPDIQRLLGRLHIGVVGAGGTGSAVIEQLIRLGVGTVSSFDGDLLEGTNVTRVHGSGLVDDGKPKVQVQSEHVEHIGLGTLLPFPKHIDKEEIAKELRACDVIFGCTDKQTPRGILVRLSHWYLIPFIDTAVKIDAPEGQIRGITGRVTTVMPGEACLFCRGRIDPQTIRAESLPPEQRDRELEEGYIPNLETEEPAVVMFTTAVACQAVSELLHRLTGFMGPERVSSEALILFHEGRIRTNREPPSAECLCQQRENWGRGDSRDFLGRMW